MAKSTQSAALADLNAPTPKPKGKTFEHGGKTPPDRRTVAPTPDAEKDGAKDGASVTETVRKAASDKANEAQAQAADMADDHAERIKDAGEAYGSDSYAHMATEHLADSLTQAADAMRSTDLGALTDDVGAFARRQPLLFFGGAALLGFAAGRMLKASERADTSASYTSRTQVS